MKKVLSPSRTSFYLVLKFIELKAYWKRGEVVLLLLCAASPKASLLGRRASGTLGDTTRPSNVPRDCMAVSNEPSERVSVGRDSSGA